jgi:hypothetical protein
LGKELAVPRFTYAVESIGLENVRRARELPTMIQRLLNEKDADGWEFLESHPAPDEPSTRIFVFRRHCDSCQPN